MQIRTKINVISYGLGLLVAATLTMLFINLRQLSFYRQNVQFSTELLYEYLELKDLVLREYKEVFDLEHTRDLGSNAESEINLRQGLQAKQAVTTMLATIAATNQRHRNSFAAKPFVIAFRDEGAALNDTDEDVKNKYFVPPNEKKTHSSLQARGTVLGGGDPAFGANPRLRHLLPKFFAFLEYARS